MPHWLYLVTSYYEKWLYCYEKILEAKGVITRAEIITAFPSRYRLNELHPVN